MLGPAAGFARSSRAKNTDAGERVANFEGVAIAPITDDGLGMEGSFCRVGRILILEKFHFV